MICKGSLSDSMRIYEIVPNSFSSTYFASGVKMTLKASLSVALGNLIVTPRKKAFLTAGRNREGWFGETALNMSHPTNAPTPKANNKFFVAEFDQFISTLQDNLLEKIIQDASKTAEKRTRALTRKFGKSFHPLSVFLNTFETFSRNY